MMKTLKRSTAVAVAAGVLLLTPTVAHAAPTPVASCDNQNPDVFCIQLDDNTLLPDSISGTLTITSDVSNPELLAVENGTIKLGNTPEPVYDEYGYLLPGDDMEVVDEFGTVTGTGPFEGFQTPGNVNDRVVEEVTFTVTNTGTEPLDLKVLNGRAVPFVFTSEHDTAARGTQADLSEVPVLNGEAPEMVVPAGTSNSVTFTVDRPAVTSVRNIDGELSAFGSATAYSVDMNNHVATVTVGTAYQTFTGTAEDEVPFTAEGITGTSRWVAWEAFEDEPTPTVATEPVATPEESLGITFMLVLALTTFLTASVILQTVAARKEAKNDLFARNLTEADLYKVTTEQADELRKLNRTTESKGE